MSHSRTGSNPNTDSFTSLRHHDTYYLTGGDLFILVTPFHFRVHRYFFERESEYFQKKLAGPASPGAVRSGGSESSAIILEDVTADDFAQFLWVFYNPKYSLYDTPLENWIKILELAHRWSFPEVKALVIRELEKAAIVMTEIDRIILYHKYGIDKNLLISRYRALCEREQPPTLEEGLRMGMDTTISIYTTRERSRAQPGIKKDDLTKLIKEMFHIPEPEEEEAVAATVADAPSTSTLPKSPNPIVPPTNGATKDKGTPTAPPATTSATTGPVTPPYSSGHITHGHLSKQVPPTVIAPPLPLPHLQINLLSSAESPQQIVQKVEQPVLASEAIKTREVEEEEETRKMALEDGHESDSSTSSHATYVQTIDINVEFHGDSDKPEISESKDIDSSHQKDVDWVDTVAPSVKQMNIAVEEMAIEPEADAELASTLEAQGDATIADTDFVANPQDNTLIDLIPPSDPLPAEQSQETFTLDGSAGMNFGWIDFENQTGEPTAPKESASSNPFLFITSPEGVNFSASADAGATQNDEDLSYFWNKPGGFADIDSPLTTTSSQYSNVDGAGGIEQNNEGMQGVEITNSGETAANDIGEAPPIPDFGFDVNPFHVETKLSFPNGTSTVDSGIVIPTANEDIKELVSDINISTEEKDHIQMNASEVSTSPAKCPSLTLDPSETTAQSFCELVGSDAVGELALSDVAEGANGQAKRPKLIIDVDIGTPPSSESNSKC